MEIPVQLKGRRHKINGVHRILTLTIFFSGMAIFSAPSSALGAQDSHAERPLCTAKTLPSEIENRIRTDFGTWSVQAPENLSHAAQLRWQGEQSSGCPGIAKGLFKSQKQTSYAVLLVPSGHPDAAYQLVVFTPKEDNSGYEESIVEKSDDRGASNYFIRQVPIARFFGESSKRKFHVRTSEAILMVDAAEDEYEADVYFWSLGRFQQEPVDY